MLTDKEDGAINALTSASNNNILWKNIISVIKTKREKVNLYFSKDTIIKRSLCSWFSGSVIWRYILLYSVDYVITNCLASPSRRASKLAVQHRLKSCALNDLYYESKIKLDSYIYNAILYLSDLRIALNKYDNSQPLAFKKLFYELKKIFWIKKVSITKK